MKEICGAPPQAPGDRYRPPPEHACTTARFDIPIDPGNRLACYQRVYKTRIVHFSIEHQHRWDGRWKTVARIDSSQTVHLHLWDRYGSVLIDHRLICEIPPSPEGQAVVHAEYGPAQDYLDLHWREQSQEVE